MIVLCSLAVVCASVVHGAVRQSSNIRLTTGTVGVGSRIAAVGEYPYQASLRAGGVHFCGGVVLNKRFILTAAHCTTFQPLYTFVVVVGTNSIYDIGEKYFVDKVVIHQDFDVEEAINDVSMVLVSEDIEFSRRVQPIRLPVAETRSGSNLTLTGWSSASYPGSLSSMLQVITLISLHWQPCRDRFNGSHVYSSQICSLTKTGRGACLGDSGGPVVQDGRVVGIVSWGMPCARGYPDINTSVYYFRNWILNQIYSVQFE